MATDSLRPAIQTSLSGSPKPAHVAPCTRWETAGGVISRQKSTQLPPLRIPAIPLSASLASCVGTGVGFVWCTGTLCATIRLFSEKDYTKMKFLVKATIFSLSIVSFAGVRADEAALALRDLKTLEYNNLRLFHQFYYRHPRPDLIPSAWNLLVTNKIFANPNSRRHFVPFYATIFCQEGVDLKRLDKQLKRVSEADSAYYFEALSICGNPTAHELVQAYTKTAKPETKDFMVRMSESKPVNFLELALDRPDKVDGLWNCFFASGDIRYVERILVASKDEGTDPLVKSSAQFSLSLNAKEHPRIRQIIEAK